MGQFACLLESIKKPWENTRHAVTALRGFFHLLLSSVSLLTDLRKQTHVFVFHNINKNDNTSLIYKHAQVNIIAWRRPTKTSSPDSGLNRFICADDIAGFGTNVFWKTLAFKVDSQFSCPLPHRELCILSDCNCLSDTQPTALQYQTQTLKNYCGLFATSWFDRPSDHKTW